MRTARIWGERVRGLGSMLGGEESARLTSLAVAALLLALASCILLSHLGDEPLAMWDEARLAVNAQEMRATGDPIVTRYDGAPDLWNTKPPLAIWLQATFLGFVDPPELAVRLPAALATIATVLLVFVFLGRELDEPWAGTLAGLVLLATPAFIGYHAGRSGDYDSLLVLWTTLYCTAWYRYCRTGRAGALATFAAGIALATLTKGIAGMLMTPGLLVFTLAERRLGAVLRDGRAWAAVAAALAVPLAWYALREHAAPGYIAAMLANEPGSFGSATDGTRADWLFLLKGMADRRLMPWFYLFPLAWIVTWFVSAPLARWSTCLLVAFFAVVESSSTRLSWYDLPSYPIVAIVIGIAAASLLRHSLAALAPRRRWLLPTAIAAGCALPLVHAATRVQQIDWHADPRLDYGEALAQIRAGRVTVLDGGVPNTAGLRNYNAVLLFHAERARARGVDVRIVHPEDALAGGQRFLTCDPDALAALRRRFALSGETKSGPCVTASVGAPVAISSLTRPTSATR